MPFKSEKQRKYLWANEPEIARDWTETYGSKVKKADGGIMKNIKGHDHMLAYITPGEAKSLENMGGQKTMTPEGIPAYPPGEQQAANFGGKESSSRGNTTSNNNTRGNGNARENYRRTQYTRQGQKANQTTRPKSDPKDYGLSNKNLDRGGIKSFIDSAKNFYTNKIYDRRPHDLKARRNFLMKNNLMRLDPVLDQDEYDDPRYSDNDWLTSGEGLAHLQGLGYTGGMLNPADDRGNYPYIYPPIETVSVEETSTPTTTSTAGLGSGHFLVPIDYVQNRRRAATGGVMDIVDRESIIKTPDEEIVTDQMEEIEGQTAGGGDRGWQAQMLAEEMAYSLYGKEFYDLSNDMQMEIYGKALHEIDEMLLGMAQGGRVPAAFGGIMDTSTGRRKYGFGSIFKAATKPFKKAAKAVKKLAGSKLGKLALMYAAGTYLGGTQALSGQMGGAGTFAQRLRDPKLLANLVNSQGTWGTAGKAVDASTKYGQFDLANQAKRLAGGENKSLLSKGLGFLRDNPMKAIVGTSLGAGLLTDKMPVEELDQADDEYDAEKEAFDAYLASLGGSYRVPEEYLLAKGGRVAAQEGGLMNLGGMEKDYRNDGGFVPIGGEEKADDVPARLSRNEFVFTADAVRSAGGGDIDKGAEVMENVMKNLEQGGTVSEESQGKGGAQDMFEVSERLSEVM